MKIRSFLNSIFIKNLKELKKFKFNGRKQYHLCFDNIVIYMYNYKLDIIWAKI